LREFLFYSVKGRRNEYVKKPKARNGIKNKTRRKRKRKTNEGSPQRNRKNNR